MSNTVKLLDYLHHQEEQIASGAITPGMLVEPTTAVDTVKAHATAKGDAIPQFAFEDELQGKSIEDVIATGQPVQVIFPARGDKVNALLAPSQTIVIGDYLVSAGDGTLEKLAVEASDLGMRIVGQALEGVTTTAAVARIKIRVA